MKSINIRDTFQTVVLHQTNSKIKFIIVLEFKNKSLFLANISIRKDEMVYINNVNVYNAILLVNILFTYEAIKHQSLQTGIK